MKVIDVKKWLILKVSRTTTRRFESCLRRISAHECAALFIITIPSSRYDVNNVERDVKHEIIIIIRDRSNPLKTQELVVIYVNWAPRQ